LSTQLYGRLEAQVRALLDGERDFVANAGNFAALTPSFPTLTGPAFISRRRRAT